MDNLLIGSFPLFSSPQVYVIQLHMRNLINHFEGELKTKIPKHLYTMHFDNWVASVGLECVEEALTMMGRSIDGTKRKKVKAA